MIKAEEAESWLGFAVNYPNIILGIMIGSVFTFILFHKGWITLPSIVARMDELKDALRTEQILSHKLSEHVKFLEEALAGSADYFEFKDKIAKKSLESLMPSGSYKKLDPEQK